MKLNKSTTILLNAVLLLVMAFLLKAIVSTPPQLHAAANAEYLVVQDTARNDSAELQKILNGYASQGWKFHSEPYGHSQIIFMR